MTHTGYHAANMGVESRW